MSVAGALCAAFFALAFVLLWRDDNAAGPLLGHAHRTELWIVVGTLIAGIAWYVGNLIYRRRQGSRSSWRSSRSRSNDRPGSKSRPRRPADRLEAADRADARVVGSAGIRHALRARSRGDGRVEPPCKDLDLDRALAATARRFAPLLEARGYVVDRDLLVGDGGAAIQLRAPGHGARHRRVRRAAEFCHTLELDGRLERHPRRSRSRTCCCRSCRSTSSTETDVIDAAVVLATHEVGPGDPERIDRDYVAGVLASDWGFHRDATANLDRVATQRRRIRA